MNAPSQISNKALSSSGKVLCFTLVAGVVVGLILSIRVHTTPPLAFEPEICDHREHPVIDGEPIRCISKLVNNTGADFILSEISKGCGCISVLSNGKELSFPLRLAPKNAIPIEVTMATETRVGFQDYAISAEGYWEKSGEKISTSLTIMGAVLPSIRATPGMLYATCSPSGTASAEFILEDGFPGAGVAVKWITATNQDHFVIEKKPVSLPDSAAPDALYKKRQLVRVRYKPANGTTIFDETITVYPQDPKVKPLLVPFQGKVLPAFTFSPGIPAVNTLCSLKPWFFSLSPSFTADLSPITFPIPSTQLSETYPTRRFEDKSTTAPPHFPSRDAPRTTTHLLGVAINRNNGAQTIRLTTNSPTPDGL